MAVDASGAAQDGAQGRRALDVHAHAMPLPLLQRLADRRLADLDEVPDGIVRLDPRVSGVGPWAPLPLARSQFDVAVRLSEMDSIGVDRHAVSLPPFLFASTAEDRQFVSDVVRPGNDELAVYVADAPEHLLGLGSVPLGFPDAADEARRCLDDLGLAGIAIGSRGGGRDLDHPVNDDLWALLAERGTFIFLHPSGVPDPKRVGDWYMPQLVGYPAETAIAVARLVYSRALERFPINLCLAHGGGCLPALRGRMDMGWERKEVARTTTLPPSAYVDRLYYDTAVFNTTLLGRLVEDVGAGHVMMGTDHPFELADFTPVETVRALCLEEDDTRAILWDNAARLLRLPTSAEPARP
jgi:aminocarboxymuconate-semialdehyde decarboxylase